MTIIYEVTSSVTQTIADEYLGWLRKHVQEMLQVDGFEKAHIHQSDQGGFVVHYHVSTYNALEQYFSKQAPMMRQQGKDRFGDALTISRRILTAI